MALRVPLVFFDCETIGLSPQIGHRVVEIGAVRLHNWQVVSEFSQLIQPDLKMEPGDGGSRLVPGQFC